MAPQTGSLRLTDPYPKPTGARLVVSQDAPADPPKSVSFEDGILKIDNADGSTTIDFNPSAADLDPENGELGNSDEHDANLAKHMDDGELSAIATQLLDGIDRDEQSRSEWLQTRALGISLLGLKLEKTRSDISSSGGPLEGMSTVRHPLLLEATVSFQATARAELLPAAGPAKFRNDSPMPPADLLKADPEAIGDADDLSHALEKDFNHYLTTTATEFVPDTDRMLFYVGFGGDGFKKVYNCPLRRRPVSESVDAENLIVSNASTDLQNSSRITHRIKMRQSVLRRMQILGAYRDVDLAPPAIDVNKNPVDKKKEEIAGINTSVQRPEDRDYEVFEVYCELDLNSFAPDQFKDKSLPLPYRVTVEKESRQVLAIYRNWAKEDEECTAKQYFVQFPLIRGLGFYGLGYIHLLGNTTVALTAAWRLQIDNGMFSNFPGFLYSKGLGRQLTNQFRVPPGGGIGLDIGAQQSIRDAVMALPYKETGPSFSAFSSHIEEVGRRLASTANIQVGEGKQDAPVGTTLALIEQASKVMDSAHKRLHAAQAEELRLLVDRFRDDPEAFWRHNKKPTIQWKKDQFLKALDCNEITPVSDPNNPTSLHRLAKGMAIKELQKATPELYDAQAVDLRIMRISDIDPEGLFKATQTGPPPDPRLIAIQQKAASSDKQNQIQLLEAQIKANSVQVQAKNSEQERISRERIEQMKIQLERLRIQEESMIHAGDAQRAQQETRQKMQLSQAEHGQKLQLAGMGAMADARHNQFRQAHELHQNHQQQQEEARRDQFNHHQQMMRDRQSHEQKMTHNQQAHESKLESAKQMAKVAKRDKPAKKETSDGT